MNIYAHEAEKRIKDSLINKAFIYKWFDLSISFIYSILSLSYEIKNHGVVMSGRTYEPSVNIFKKVDK